MNFSPDEIERRYDRGENKLNAWLANRGTAVVIAATMGVIGLFVYIARFLGPEVRLLPQVVSDVSFFRWALPVIPLLGLVALLAPINQSLMRGLSLFVLWILAIVPVSLSLHFSTLKIAGVVMSLPLIITILSLWVHHNAGKARGKYLPLMAFFAISAAFIFFRFSDPGEAMQLALYLWFRFKLGFLFLFTFAILGRKEIQADWRILWNPAHIMHGVLWTRGVALNKNDFHARRALWWRGMANVLQAGICILLIVLYCENYPRRLNWTAHSNFSSFGWYLTHFFADISVFTLFTGTARIFGFSVADMVRFPLLSRNPAEYWQRINTYNYSFISEYLFFPVARRLRDPLIASFIAFLAFYFQFCLSYCLIVPLSEDGDFHFYSEWKPGFFWSWTFFFAFQFILLVVGRTIWPLARRPGESSSRAWASVLLTHTSLYTSHFLSRWLAILLIR